MLIGGNRNSRHINIFRIIFLQSWPAIDLHGKNSNRANNKRTKLVTDMVQVDPAAQAVNSTYRKNNWDRHDKHELLLDAATALG